MRYNMGNDQENRPQTPTEHCCWGFCEISVSSALGYAASLGAAAGGWSNIVLVALFGFGSAVTGLSGLAHLFCVFFKKDHEQQAIPRSNDETWFAKNRNDISPPGYGSRDEV